MKLHQLNPEEVVGAKGFEPSTSRSRTRESKILKSCRCRTYGPSDSQNLPSVGPHGTQAHGLRFCDDRDQGFRVTIILGSGMIMISDREPWN